MAAHARQQQRHTHVAFTTDARKTGSAENQVAVDDASPSSSSSQSIQSGASIRNDSAPEISLRDLHKVRTCYTILGTHRRCVVFVYMQSDHADLLGNNSCLMPSTSCRTTHRCEMSCQCPNQPFYISFMNLTKQKQHRQRHQSTELKTLKVTHTTHHATEAMIKG